MSLVEGRIPSAIATPKTPRSSQMLGKYVRKQYGELFPKKHKKSKGGKKKKGSKIPPYKVRWHACRIR